MHPTPLKKVQQTSTNFPQVLIKKKKKKDENGQFSTES